MILCTITDAALLKYPREQGGLQVFKAVSYFKVGEGGWVDPGTGKVRRTPDPTLTDLDCIVNPSRYPVDSRFTFQKTLQPNVDMVIDAGALKMTCTLAQLEANDDGLGNNPEFWEIGIFDEDDVMLIYATMPEQIKSNAGAITDIIRQIWAR